MDAVAIATLNAAGVPVIGGPSNPVPVSGLVAKGAALVTGTAYQGFRVDLPGSTTWSATFSGGGTVSFTPLAGEEFPWSVSSVTPGTSGTGIGYLA